MTHLRLLAILSGFPAGACSLALVHGPSSGLSAHQRRVCTTRSAAPGVDLALGVALGVATFALGIAIAGMEGFDCEPGECHNPVTASEGVKSGAVAAAVAAPWILSSVAGYGRMAACRRAHASAGR